MKKFALFGVAAALALYYISKNATQTTTTTFAAPLSIEGIGQKAARLVELPYVRKSA